MLDVGKPLIDEKLIEKNIPEVKQQNQDQEEIIGLEQSGSTNLVIIFTYIILILFVFSSVGLYLLKLSKTSTFKNKQEAFSRLDKQLKTKEFSDVDKQYQVIFNGLKNVESIFDKRVSYNTLLNEIDKNLVNDVKLLNLSISDEYNAKMTGETANEESVAKIVWALNNSNKFSSVNLKGMNKSSNINTDDKQEVVSFSIDYMVEKNNLEEESNE